MASPHSASPGRLLPPSPPSSCGRSRAAPAHCLRRPGARVPVSCGGVRFWKGEAVEGRDLYTLLSILRDGIYGSRASLAQRKAAARARRRPRTLQKQISSRRDQSIMAPERSCEEEAEDPILTRILGSSTVFRGLAQPKLSIRGLLLPNKIKEHFHHGQDAMFKGEWEKAVLAFSKAINLNPQLVESYVLRAEAYLQLCDFASAAQNLRKASLLAPQRSQFMERLCFVLYLQGQCLFEQQAYMKALDLFTQASELQPHKPSYRFRSIACLLAMKRHQECLRMVTKELKQDSNPDVYILRARLYNYFLKMRKLRQREMCPGSHSWIHPGFFRLLTSPVIFLLPSEPNQCYQDLRQALTIKPEHPEANTLLEKLLVQARKAREEAVVMALKGNLEDSLIRINCAIDNSPMDPGYYLFRGTLFRRLKDFDAAIEDFLKALDLSPEDEEDNEIARQAQRQLLLTYNDFAVFCYARGAYEEGVLLLDKALRGEKREKGIYINRGDCFFKLGELTFAEADYLEALALSPGDQGARYRMGMLQEKLGLRKHQLRQYHEAEKHFSSAIEYNPEKANFYLFRARSRLMLQNIFGARQDVATLLLLNPRHPELIPMMANLFPGHSTESVLNSKTMAMAKTLLERAIQNQLYQYPQNILGLLNKGVSPEKDVNKTPDTIPDPEQAPNSGETGNDTSGIQDQTLDKDNTKQAMSEEEQPGSPTED
ncbi:tetratricopeptide repeat protein 16 isoform X2 [Notamacropus eugenii]|uniref:tetratricopeptide repeat protein 16 isoform X2 n=1 Tax=Notamacropus eugenii TaxID=9315 RepID=UPI003B67FD98